ncbi:hypothetical protein MP638_000951 [Amoeboaphelidium occidentale]|nr:hypothetical protein MP638_000951 [Amoeboaphelidium occidentale]
MKSNNVLKLSTVLAIISAVSASEWFAGTATFFGGKEDQEYDPLKVKGSCVINNLLSYGEMETAAKAGYYAAPDDGHPEIWWSDPPCEQNPSGQYPVCSKQRSCGKCVEVACIGKLDKDKMDDTTQFGRCKPGTSTVLKIIDACPGIHPNNAGKEKNLCASEIPHLDIAYRAFEDIGYREDGQLHVMVRKVDCSVGLGVKENGFSSAEDARKAYDSRGDGKGNPVGSADTKDNKDQADTADKPDPSGNAAQPKADDSASDSGSGSGSGSDSGSGSGSDPASGSDSGSGKKLCKRYKREL